MKARKFRVIQLAIFVLLLAVPFALAIWMSPSGSSGNKGQTPVAALAPESVPTRAVPQDIQTGLPQVIPTGSYEEIKATPTATPTSGLVVNGTFVPVKNTAELYKLLFEQKGTVIAQGGSNTPACYNGPKSYQIEEIALPEMTTLNIGGRQVTTDKYWRVTVQGGLLSANKLPAGIWIGNILIGYRPRIKGLEEISIITFESAILQEGARIWLSYEGSPLADPDAADPGASGPFEVAVTDYGVGPSDEFIPSNAIELPVKLHFPDGRAGLPVSTPLPTPKPELKATIAAGMSVRPKPDGSLPTPTESPLDALYHRKGTVIAHWERSEKTCYPKPDSYQVEEVSLPQAMSFDIREPGGKASQVTTDKFWRLTTTGEYLPGSGFWATCVDGVPLHYGGIAFDRSVLHEGASIYFVYGNGSCSGSPSVIVPEKLHFGSPRYGLSSPDPTEEACKRVDQYRDFLYSQKGTVIAKGKNQKPTCFNGVKTYRIEEITLPGPKEFEVKGKKITADKYWRITVSGESFRAGERETIRIDDTFLDAEGKNAALTEIAAVTFDRSILHEGATIKSSARGHDPEELPERLHFNVSP